MVRRRGVKSVTVESSDMLNFSVGMRIELTDSDYLVPATRWQRLRTMLGRVLRRATWWRYPRTVVSAIDEKNASIALHEQRWTFRRWRWE